MSHEGLPLYKKDFLHWYKFDFFDISRFDCQPEGWINFRILYFKRGPEFSNIESLIVLSGFYEI